MPLPETTVSRTPLHERKIRLQGFERADGLWDIEAWMEDTKRYGFANQDRGGWIAAGEPLHGMGLRVTLDDGMTVREVVAVTDHGPYTACPGATPNYQRLVGERVGPGWRKRVRQIFAGAGGCTHLTELLDSVATVAIQTIMSRRYHRGDFDGAKGRSPLINTCHAYASDGAVVAREWPDQYTGPRTAVDTPKTDKTP